MPLKNDLTGFASALPATVRSGVLRPIGARALIEIWRSYRTFGPTVGLLFTVAAARYPDRVAIIDEHGPLTYRELVRRGNAIAGALHTADPAAQSMAILCRNHRGFAEAIAAGSRLGCELIFLNTELPAAQLALILDRHRPDILVHDEEYAAAIAETGYQGVPVTAWHDGPVTSLTLDVLATQQHPQPPRVPGPVKLTLLTSGTSGLAKGVARPIGVRAVLGMAATAMKVTRLRHDDIVLATPPFFHGFGLALLIGALTLGTTVVCRRRFDPEDALADIQDHRVTVFAGVPVMLQRLLALPPARREAYDRSTLRRAVTGAAPIAPTTISAFTDAFGPILVNGYGSTEVGVVSIATADDLLTAPNTVGRPVIGVSLRILRADRTVAPAGETGTIFVRGGLVFAGYVTDPDGRAPTKEIVDGYVNTGDMGHLDTAGRLYIEGRDDEMIVSGGENIYPKEVADTLAAHPAIDDVAVIGVPDPEYGQILRAYLVTTEHAVPTDDELKTHIRERLERYKVPKEFIIVTEIPRNPSGKILRHQL